MFEDEKNAVEILKSWKNYNVEHKNILLQADEIISVQETILNLIDRLLKENEEYSKQLDLDYLDKNYILKQKVKDKIEELKKEKEEYYSEYKIDELNDKIQVLQELLESEE